MPKEEDEVDFRDSTTRFEDFVTGLMNLDGDEEDVEPSAG